MSFLRWLVCWLDELRFGGSGRFTVDRSLGRVRVKVGFGVKGGFGITAFCTCWMFGSGRFTVAWILRCVRVTVGFGAEGGFGITAFCTCWMPGSGRFTVARISRHIRGTDGFGIKGGFGIISSCVDWILGKTGFVFRRCKFSLLSLTDGWNTVFARLANFARRWGSSFSAKLVLFSLTTSSLRVCSLSFSFVSTHCNSSNSCPLGAASSSVSWSWHIALLLFCSGFRDASFNASSWTDCGESASRRLGDILSLIAGRVGNIRLRNSALNSDSVFCSAVAWLLSRARFSVGGMLGRSRFTLGTLELPFASVCTLGTLSSSIVERLNRWLTEAAPRKTSCGWMLHRRSSWTTGGKHSKILLGVCFVFLYSFNGIQVRFCFSAGSRLGTVKTAAPLNDNWMFNIFSFSVSWRSTMSPGEESFILGFGLISSVFIPDKLFSRGVSTSWFILVVFPKLFSRKMTHDVYFCGATTYWTVVVILPSNNWNCD